MRKIKKSKKTVAKKKREERKQFLDALKHPNNETEKIDPYGDFMREILEKTKEAQKRNQDIWEYPQKQWTYKNEKLLRIITRYTR